MSNKTAIVYLYKEDDESRKNLDFFIKKSKQNNLCTYYLIINNDICSLNVPDFFIINKQENNFDFPSYKKFIANNDLSNYEYIYFLNSSCIGPFVPTYCEMEWYQYTNNFFEKYDFIGSIAEVPPSPLYSPQDEFKKCPFIHTYMFGLNKKTFNVFSNLLKKYDNFDKNFCILFERMLSYEILNQNYKIKSFLTVFNNVDLNNKKNWDYLLWNQNEKTCYEIPNNYFGIDVNPYEIIFIKNIRKENETRKKDVAGISENLKKQISNYVSWS